MNFLYFPLGTYARVTLECGHSDTRPVCGEFSDHSQLFCQPCRSYERLNTIVVTHLGPEQGSGDIDHHLPEIAS